MCSKQYQQLQNDDYRIVGYPLYFDHWKEINRKDRKIGIYVIFFMFCPQALIEKKIIFDKEVLS